MANYRSCTSKEKAVYPQGKRGGIGAHKVLRTRLIGIKCLAG